MLEKHDLHVQRIKPRPSSCVWETLARQFLGLSAMILLSRCRLSMFSLQLQIAAQPGNFQCHLVECAVASTITLEEENLRTRGSSEEICKTGCNAHIKRWASHYCTDYEASHPLRPPSSRYFDLCQSAPGFVMKLHQFEALPTWNRRETDSCCPPSAIRRRLSFDHCFCEVNVTLIAWEPNPNWSSPFAEKQCESQKICSRAADSFSTIATGARPVWNYNHVDPNDPWTDCFGFEGTLKARNPDSFYRSGIRSHRVFRERIAEIEDFGLGPITPQEAIAVRQFRLAPVEGRHSITFHHMGHFGGGYVLNAAEFDESQQIASFWNDIEKAFHEMDEIDLDQMDVKKIIEEPESQAKTTSEDVGTSELFPPFL